MSLRHFASVLLLSVFALCAPSPVSAVELREPAPAEKPAEPIVQVFGGYSGYRFGGNLDGVKVPDFRFGWASQFIVNAAPNMAVVVDVSGHYNESASAHDFAIGPRFQRPLWRFNPFVEILIGVQHFASKGLPSQNSPTYIGGVGMDVKVNSALSIRPFQLSYIGTCYSAGPTAVLTSVQQNYFSGFRVQAGLTYNLKWFSSKGRVSSPEGRVSSPEGGVSSSEGRVVLSEREVLASCSAEPPAVGPGVKVKIGVTPKGFLPKRTLSYSYATTGGAISGSTATESVDTTGVGPGTYTVTAKVADKSKGTRQQTASCKTQFTVNAKQTPPPLVAAEQPPQPPPPVASEQTKQTPPLVAAEQPKQTPPSPVAADKDSPKHGDASATTDTAQTSAKDTPKPSRFGIVQFERDLKRPTRVDNEAKGELDRYADALAMTPDATGVVVGYAGAKDGKDSKYVLGVASQRAVNTKDYVAKDKGIDPARIEPRTGSADGQKTELWILPAAATFAAEDTKVVNENKVKAIPRVALKTRGAHKKLHRTVRHKGVHKSN